MILSLRLSSKSIKMTDVLRDAMPCSVVNICRNYRYSNDVSPQLWVMLGRDFVLMDIKITSPVVKRQ
jgi:hypothetical protein